jgi:hypothetical protein
MFVTMKQLIERVTRAGAGKVPPAWVVAIAGSLLHMRIKELDRARLPA